MTRFLDNMKLSALAAAIALCMPSSLTVSRESLTNLQLPLQAPKTLVQVPVVQNPLVENPLVVELAEELTEELAVELAEEELAVGVGVPK